MNRLEEIKSKIERTEAFIEALKKRLQILREESRSEIQKQNLAFDPLPLTSRQREIFPLLRDYSNKDIGRRLNISPYTVKFHVGKILRKFAVKRRYEV